MRVALLVPPEHAAAAAKISAASTTFHVVPVQKGSAVLDVMKAVASGDFDGFANLCHGSLGTAEVASIDVAQVLREARVPFTGVDPKVLNFTRGDIAMMGFYSEANIFVASHKLVTRGTVSTAGKDLTFPLMTASNTTNRGSWLTANTEEELLSALKSVLLEDYSAFVTDAVPINAHIVTAHVVEALDSSSPPVVHIVPTVDAEILAELEKRVRGLFKDTYGKFGAAEFRIALRADPTAHNGLWIRLIESVPNPPLFDSPMFTSDFSLGSWISACLRKEREPTPAFTVTYDPKLRGYFVRAARDLQKGDIVFPDEASPQTIVTKPYVQQNWNEADRETFSRYAWPLDTGGHVYAMWHDHPRKWRPINHSCNPTVVFADGHSLNAIASRNLKAGEDLTLDYTTFCDYTMKPFQCFCGSENCRGEVKPDAACLAVYGTNAWHRKMPVEENTFSTKQQ